MESVDQAEASKSLVGRRYLAVKGAVLCIYKEEKDFVDDAPVVELEMKLACVKVRGGGALFSASTILQRGYT